MGGKAWTQRSQLGAVKVNYDHYTLNINQPGTLGRTHRGSRGRSSLGCTGKEVAAKRHSGGQARAPWWEGGSLARGTQTCNFPLSDLERAEGGRPRLGHQKYQVGLWCDASSLEIVWQSRGGRAENPGREAAGSPGWFLSGGQSPGLSPSNLPPPPLWSPGSFGNDVSPGSGHHRGKAQASGLSTHRSLCPTPTRLPYPPPRVGAQCRPCPLCVSLNGDTGLCAWEVLKQQTLKSDFFTIMRTPEGEKHALS